MTKHLSPQADKANTMRVERTSLVTWDELSSHENHLLDRVESQVLDYHDRQQQSQQKPSVATQKPAYQPVWRWPALVGSLAMMALLVWTLRSPERPLPTLQAEGTLKLVSLPQQSTTSQEVRTQLENKATLKDPQGWELQAHAQTQLQIVRQAPKRSVIAMKRGAASFYVKPGSMKQFVVKCPNQLQVVVKGTKFLVWQTPEGTRVEVTRGHVLLRRGGKALLHLYKGQGAYFKNSSFQTWQTYTVPPKKQNWLGKLEGLAQSKPQLLFSYVRDLQKQKLLAPAMRVQLLEMAAHALQGSKRFGEAAQLWWSLFRHQTNPLAQQTALFQAAQSCRLSRQKRSRCIRWYSAFLKRYPQGLDSLRETSLFWKAQLMLKSSPEQAVLHLQTYLKRYPQGSYAGQAKRVLEQKGRF